MEKMKVEVYGDKIARVAISADLQNKLHIKYNKIIEFENNIVM